MKDIVLKVSDKFDYILIDSPAGVEEGFRIAIAAAKEALVVITPELASIRDADKVIGLLLSKSIPQEKINLVINRVRPEMVQRNNMISVDDIVDILSADIIGVIPEDKNIIISTNRGEPIVKDKGKSLISQSLKDTANRICGKKIPFLDLESNWIKRLFFKNLFSAGENRLTVIQRIYQSDSGINFKNQQETTREAHKAPNENPIGAENQEFN